MVGKERPHQKAVPLEQDSGQSPVKSYSADKARRSRCTSLLQVLGFVQNVRVVLPSQTMDPSRPSPVGNSRSLKRKQGQEKCAARFSWHSFAASSYQWLRKSCGLLFSSRFFFHELIQVFLNTCRLLASKPGCGQGFCAWATL